MVLHGYFEHRLAAAGGRRVRKFMFLLAVYGMFMGPVGPCLYLTQSEQKGTFFCGLSAPWTLSELLHTKGTDTCPFD